MNYQPVMTSPRCGISLLIKNNREENHNMHLFNEPPFFPKIEYFTPPDYRCSHTAATYLSPTTTTHLASSHAPHALHSSYFHGVTSLSFDKPLVVTLSNLTLRLHNFMIKMTQLEVKIRGLHSF